MTEMNSERKETIFRGLLGSECIFKEKWLVMRVRVSGVSVDDNLVSFTLESLLTEGLCYLAKPAHLNVSSSWETLGVSDRAITASYSSWTLVIREDLVERIQNAALGIESKSGLTEAVNRIVYDCGDETD